MALRRALRRMNEILGSIFIFWSDSSSSEEADEKSLPTHRKGRPKYTRKSFRRAHLILQLASCVIAVALDPLFLYIPVINHHEKCFHFDNKLRIAALVLRSVTDFIFMLHIAFQFSYGNVAFRIRRRPIRFFIAILSLIPIPQVVILSVIPKMKGSKSLTARNILTALVVLQYVPRVVRIYPLYNKLTRKKTPWTKAAPNLFLYVLASHVLGALWYFFSIEREITCWQEACKGHPGCDHSSFFCHDGIRLRAVEFLHHICLVDTPNTKLFDFGIFLDALESGIVESVNLPQKFFRCLWWGLQSLSSFGQNLKTSTYVGENIFAVFISTSGLVLFVYFIGNMQAYLQLKPVKEEKKRMEIRSKEKAVDSWMSKNNLPEDIKRRIRHSVKKKWHEIRTVDSEKLIPILPKDLQKDIKRHICLDLVKRVPEFASMEDHQLEAICDSLKPVVYPKESYVIRKGDRVKEMCFIIRGEVLSWSTDANVGGTETSPVLLKTGGLCGEELLTWFSNVPPSTNLLISKKTARARTEVEAFAITAEDLKVFISKPHLSEGGTVRPGSGSNGEPSLTELLRNLNSNLKVILRTGSSRKR